MCVCVFLYACVVCLPACVCGCVCLCVPKQYWRMWQLDGRSIGRHGNTARRHRHVLLLLLLLLPPSLFHTHNTHTNTNGERTHVGKFPHAHTTLTHACITKFGPAPEETKWFTRIWIEKLNYCKRTIKLANMHSGLGLCSFSVAIYCALFGRQLTSPSCVAHESHFTRKFRICFVSCIRRCSFCIAIVVVLTFSTLARIFCYFLQFFLVTFYIFNFFFIFLRFFSSQKICDKSCAKRNHDRSLKRTLLDSARFSLADFKRGEMRSLFSLVSRYFYDKEKIRLATITRQSTVYTF